MDERRLRLEVRVDLFGNDGTRLGINEAVDLDGMSFWQLAKLLEAFHIIAESVKQGRHVSINGQEFPYFGKET